MYGVWEFVYIWYDCQYVVFCQMIVINFMMFWRIDYVGFVYGVWREVVVEQEGIGMFVYQFIKNLCVMSSIQCCGNQCLCFIMGEQCRIVSMWQYVSMYIQIMDYIFFMIVDMWFVCQYVVMNNVFFDCVQNFIQFVFVQGFVFSKQCCDGFRFDDINLCIMFLFVGDVVSIVQVSFSQCSNVCVQCFVYWFWLLVLMWFIGFFYQFIDVLNNNLLLFMIEYYCVQYLVFVQQLSFRFNYQYSGFSIGNNQIQFVFFQFVLSWVQYVLVIDVIYVGSINWVIEWNIRQRQCCGSINYCDDIWVNLWVNRNYGGDNLNFVDEVFWEQWVNWVVNQMCDQGFVFVWVVFMMEEVIWDMISSVGMFLIVNGQWEEVLIWFGFFLVNNGNEYCGVIYVNYNSGSSLMSYYVGFQSYGVLVVLEFMNDWIK